MSLALEASAAPAAAVLEVVNLSHRYGPSRGLEPVSFSVAAPGVVAVTGPNGSGKSTLLRTLAGLLRPSSGTAQLSVAGIRIPDRDRPRYVGLVSPDLTFYPELSVAENLLFAAEARGLDDSHATVQAALQRVGLEPNACDRAAALSSGMTQRLRVAFALLHRPPVLLLDEPGTHMDEEGRMLVGRIVEQHGKAGLVVLATNDEREWRNAGHRIELRRRGLGNTA